MCTHDTVAITSKLVAHSVSKNSQNYYIVLQLETQ